VSAKVRRLAIALAAVFAFSFVNFNASYFGEHSKALAQDSAAASRTR